MSIGLTLRDIFFPITITFILLFNKQDKIVNKADVFKTALTTAIAKARIVDAGSAMQVDSFRIHLIILKCL